MLATTRFANWIWLIKILHPSMSCQTSVSSQSIVTSFDQIWNKIFNFWHWRPSVYKNIKFYFKFLIFVNFSWLLVNMQFVTRITLSHNKISGKKKSQIWKKNFNVHKNYFLVLPPAIANLNNLEILNLSNNHLEELPLSLSAMPKLRILNCSINRLSTLPRWVKFLPWLIDQQLKLLLCFDTFCFINFTKKKY